MRAARRIACIAMLIITVGITVNATTAFASAGNVLVDAYGVRETEGVLTASILRSLGYKVTLVESHAFPHEVPDLSKYSTVWELREDVQDTFTAPQQEALEAFVRQGGRLYLSGEAATQMTGDGGTYPVEPLNEADQAIARNLLKNQEITIAGEPVSYGSVASNPNAEDGVTTQPNVLATIPAEGAGKIGNIPNRNVLAETESGAIGGAFDQKDMLNGKGRLVIDMAVNWLSTSWHGYPAIGNAASKNRIETIENIQDYLQKTPGRLPTPSAEYVALGDSLASGVGSFSYLPGTTEGKACYQATDGYAEKLAAETDFSLNFQACKDATVARLSTGNKDQLRAVGPNTKLVTLSIGSTELGMRSIIERCLKGRSSRRSTDGCFEANNEAVQTALGWLREGRDPGTYSLPGSKKTDTNREFAFRLRVLDSLIAEQAPDAKVVVIGYPKLFETGQEHAVACDITGGAGAEPKMLDAAEVEWINQQTDALDELIRAEAAWAQGGEYRNIRFVDPRPAFAGHGLCDTGESFINPFVSEPHTPVTPESLNPTARGQEELKRLIGEAFNE
jgi:GDSL-like Lipase/Acylhydrolase family